MVERTEVDARSSSILRGGKTASQIAAEGTHVKIQEITHF